MMDSEALDSSSATRAKPSLAKRRIRSAGPRLRIKQVDPGQCDSVVSPLLSSSVGSLQSPTYLEESGLEESGLEESDGRSPDCDRKMSDPNIETISCHQKECAAVSPSSDPKRCRMVVTRCEVEPLESQSLASSILPNRQFKGLNILLQRKHDDDEGSNENVDEGLCTPSPPGAARIPLLADQSPLGASRLLVLDPAVGIPGKEKISQLVEDSVPQQPRIVSVKREECLKTEHAAMILEKDKTPKQHRAVTVSRSNTWSIRNKNTGPVVRSVSSREHTSPSLRNSSVLEEPSNVSDEDGSLDCDVSRENKEHEYAGETDLAAAAAAVGGEMQGGAKETPSTGGCSAPEKKLLLRSKSMRVCSVPLTNSQGKVNVVSWLDVEPCVKVGSLIKDGVKSQKERMTEQERMDLGYSPGGTTSSEESPLIQRCVIVHRDEKGFGFTVSGDNPVLVDNVKSNGPAYKAGVRQFDKIVKVNGNLVLNSNHTEVVKLIKSGSYVAMTLLGRQPVPPSKALDALEHNTSASTPVTSSTVTSSTVTPLSVEKEKISGPQAVDHDKDLQFKAQKVTTIQMMYKQVLEEYERMKLEYQKSPSENLQYKLQVKLQMLRRVEDQLRAIDPVAYQQVMSLTSSANHLPPSDASPVGSGFALKRPATVSSVAFERLESTDRCLTPGSHTPSVSFHGLTPWLPSGPKHQKSDSVPDTLYRVEENQTEVTSPRSEDGEGLMETDRDEFAVNTDAKVSTASVVPSTESSTPSSALPSSSIDAASSSSSSAAEAIHSATWTEAPASSQQLRTGTPPKPPLKVISPNQVKVVVMEDTDFTTVDDPGAFSDLMQLKNRPAHLAVFLHYLISNSDPAAMFFYIVTENYSQGNVKEMRKWAYEIFSTFLCDRAPLKINVDEATTQAISSVLQTKYDREDAMKNIFQSARIFAQNEINDDLTDFRSKRALGLGCLYGDRDLKDNMDRQSEMRIIETALWKHFERLMQDEDVDRNQAMASALATFFKQVGYTNQRSSLLERCTSFHARDRKMFKFKSNSKKVIHSNGHQFVTQQYFVTTHCVLCQSILWGIGNQGYQCTHCEINLHKNCVDAYKDGCMSGGTLRKKKERRPPSMFDLISRKLSNTNPAAIREAQHQHMAMDSGVSSPASSLHPSLQEEDEGDHSQRSGLTSGSLADSERSPDESKTLHSTSRDQSPDYDDDDYNPNVLSVGLGRSESLNQRAGIRASVRRAHSDVSSDNQILTTQRAGNTSSSSSNSNSSLSARTSDSSEGLNDISGVPTSTASQKSQFSDSDFDVETELPLLESIIPKELFKKLKPKEKKRQEVLNELFYTERTHVRNLKVLHRIFYLPMADDPLALLLFPNLGEVIEIHTSLNNDLKAKRKESPVVGDFADVLVKRLSGDEGEKFKMAAAKFCEQQSHALEVLRQRQRKDTKMASFLQEAASNSLCRRLELKDLILTELQRLTKYPLLIESLLKYTVSNTEEYDQLVKAHELSKNLLNYVNHKVEECENHQKLVELQRKLDRRPIENSSHPVVSEYKKLDLTRHRMIYDGVLTWRINRSKHIDHHVVLLEDILVLLQKQDDRLVLRCHSGSKESGKDDNRLPHSPIIKLNNLLARNVAVDKRALFLVSMSESTGPQIYEFAASTKDERNKWFKYITDAAEAYKAKDGKPKRPTSEESQLPDVHDDIGRKPHDLSKGDVMGHHDDVGTDTDADEDKRDGAETLEQVGRVEVLNFEPPQLVQPNEVKVSRMEVMEKLEPVKTPLDLLKEKNRLIELTMLEKKKLLSNLLQIHVDDYDHIAEIAGEVVASEDVRELLFGSLAKADELTCLINESLSESLRCSSVSAEKSKAKGPSARQPSDEDEDATPTSSPRVVSASQEMTAQLSTTGGKSSQTPDSHVGVKTTPDPTIVVPGSRLITITSQLQRHLLQLLDVIVKKESEKEEERRASDNTGRGLRHETAGGDVGFHASAAVEQQQRSVKLSAPVVTFPVVMEHVELIEVETIVPETVAKAEMTMPLDSRDCSETASVSIVPDKFSDSRET